METILRLPDAYFERAYDGNPDPWDFEASPYERRKAEVLLASLPRERYRHAFEPGCSNGALTERLATRANQVLGMEVVPTVADCARRRFSADRTVRVQTGAIPEDWPSHATFDLIVLSEVGYYLTRSGLDLAMRLVRESLSAGGDVVSVNYRGATDSPLSGADVDAAVRALPSARCLVSHEEPEFLLTVVRYEPD